MALRTRLSDDLLHLNLVDEDRIDGGIPLETRGDAPLTGAQKTERARLLQQLLQAFHPALAFVAGNERPETANDLTGSEGLFSRLADGGDRPVIRVLSLEKGLGAVEIDRDRGQGLVEFMGQRARHLAHGRQATHVDQLGLQRLEAHLGGLPLGQILEEAGEKSAVAQYSLAHIEHRRKVGSVLALSGDRRGEVR